MWRICTLTASTARSTWRCQELSHRMNFDMRTKTISLNFTTFDKAAQELIKMGFAQRGMLLPPAALARSYVRGCLHKCPQDVKFMLASVDLETGMPDRQLPVSIFQQGAGGGGSSSSPPPTLNPQFVTLFKDHYGQLIQHLKATGVYKYYSWVSFLDEPEWTDPWTLQVWLAMAKLFKNLDPAIKISQDRFPIPQIPSVMPLVDAWIGHVSQVTTPGALDNMTRCKRQYGAELYIYDNGVPILDLDLERTRTSFWQVWNTNWAVSDVANRGMGLQGSLSWWSVTSWSTETTTWPNPYQVANQDPACANRRGCPFNAAGFGMLLYPPQDFDMSKPPVSSIRWEQSLLGLQDSEYFQHLFTLAGRFNTTTCAATSASASATSCCEAVNAATAALDSISNAVWSFPQVTQFVAPFPYTSNASVAINVRADVLDAIKNLESNCIA